MEGTILDY